MLRHIVMYKLSDKSPETIERLTDGFLGMLGKIEGVIDIKCGADTVHRDRSYDYALVIDFTDRAALDAYMTHPVHLPVKKYVHSVIEKSKSVDFIM